VAQYPLIVARLVAILPGLTGWEGFTVTDGPLLADVVPTRYATVGSAAAPRVFGHNVIDDSYACDLSDLSYHWTETGTVNIELSCGSGDSGIDTVRAAVQAALNGLESAIRADRRLAILSTQGYFRFTVTSAPLLDATGSGYVARCALSYYTVTL
jgi:hypothetical protein